MKTKNISFEAFTERIKKYVESSHIQIINSPRHQGYHDLGMPDTRGFTPHLRQIQLYKEQQMSYTADQAWMLHDILHIIFYDFAALNLGFEAFDDEERFYEIHLASEIFAVLCLDYWMLSQFKGKSITVDFDLQNWPEFQKINPKLPELCSLDFTKAISDLYLEDNRRPFTVKNQKNYVTYNQWIEHEFSYTTKQRVYIHDWYLDLSQTSNLNQNIRQEIKVLNSYVFEAVHELCELFCTASDQEFNDYLSDWTENIDSSEAINYLANYEKLNETDYDSIDFRFTDYLSIEKPKHYLEQKLSAKNLFLAYQLLSSIPMENLSSEEKLWIRNLCVQANQSNEIGHDLWKNIKQLIYKNESAWAGYKIDEKLLTSFFLP